MSLYKFSMGKSHAVSAWPLQQHASAMSTTEKCASHHRRPTERQHPAPPQRQPRQMNANHHLTSPTLNYNRLSAPSPIRHQGNPCTTSASSSTPPTRSVRASWSSVS